ncbi:hypothetical protein GCM10027417_22830 [Glutamicibacter endophyticus]
MALSQRETIRVLQELGWMPLKVAGGAECRMVQADRVLTILPKLTTGSRQTVRLNPGVGTYEFDRAYATISGRQGGYTQPIVHAFGEVGVVHAELLTPEDIRGLSGRVIAWGQNQNLDAFVHELCTAATDSPGNLPVKHLAALSLAGDLDRLEHYLAAFERGDRLGFVPYIDTGYLERAITYATSKAKE